MSDNTYNGRSGRPTAGAEKRLFPRYSLSLHALCTAPGPGSWQADIRDVCTGGMFLAYESILADTGVTRALSLLHGKQISISCSVPTPSGEENLQFQVRVMRTDGSSAGVAFVDADRQVVNILLEYAKEANRLASQATRHAFPHEGELGGPDRGSQALPACREIARQYVEPLIRAFISQESEQLFTLAYEVKDVAEQNAYFNALDIYKKRGDTLITEFVALMRARLDAAPENAADTAGEWNSGAELTLSLVDANALDEWLSTKDMANRAESKYADQLTEIRERLSVIYRVHVDAENNPFGPLSFCHAFQDAVRHLNLESKAFQASCRIFKDVLAERLGDCYERINACLAGHGILPKIKYKVKRAADQGIAVARVAADAASPESAPAVHAEAAQSWTGEQQETLVSPANVTPGGAAGQKDMYQLVQTLLAMQQMAQQQAADEAGADAAARGARVFYSADEILGSLRALGGAAVTLHPLSSQSKELLGTLSANGKHVAPRETGIIQTTGQFFDFMFQDQLVANSVRPWIQQLEIPVLKMALRDDSVLFDKAHVARQLVNKIAQLELYADGDDNAGQRAVKARIDDLISKIANAQDISAENFTSALKQVGFLIQVQKKAYAENIRDAVAACERDNVAGWPDQQPLAAVAEELEPWCSRVHKMRVGSWIVAEAASSAPKRLRLVWKSGNRDRYVFVNVKGSRELVLSLGELARRFRDGDIIVLDSTEDMPVDRAQYALLQDLHRQLLYETTHDQLTGLINRREFEKVVRDTLSSAPDEHPRHCICYIDIDQFSVVNNTFGYEAGDRLLVELTELLQTQIRIQGVLARIGSDEFGMLLKNCGEQEALEVAERQKNVLHDYRFLCDEKRLSISFSVGIVPVEETGMNAVDILRAAEDACRAAKQKGVNHVHIYRRDDSDMMRRQQIMHWVARVDEFLERGCLEFRSQPIVSVKADDGISNAEILLSVMDEDGSPISPEQFISAAEYYHRMPVVDRWVIEHVFDWMAENIERIQNYGWFAINLSGLSLNDDSLIPFVVEQARRTGVPMEKVCFEVTETAGISNLSSAAEFILEMKKTGCVFSLDDFGSGLSSYAYLKNLPVDYLKIDGAFIKNMDSNASDCAVVKSITEIGHFMGKKIIAECVETEGVARELREIGVDYVQGYGIERPRRLADLFKQQ